jgi:hypothetical protein
VEVSDLVSAPDAAREFGIARVTLNRLVRQQGIKRWKRAGDRRTYLSRADLKKALAFKPKD